MYHATLSLNMAQDLQDIQNIFVNGFKENLGTFNPHPILLQAVNSI